MPEAPGAGKRGDSEQPLQDGFLRLLFYSKNLNIYKFFGFKYFKVVKIPKTLCGKCKSGLGVVKLGFMPQPLCYHCFVRQIERRVIEQLKRFIHFTSKRNIILQDNGSLNIACLHYILEKYKAKYNLEIRTVKASCKISDILPVYCLDELAVILISRVLFKEETIPSYTALLGTVHSKELELYSELKGLKGRVLTHLNEKQLAVLNELDKLEQKHPQIKFSIVRFFQKLEDLQI